MSLESKLVLAFGLALALTMTTLAVTKIVLPAVAQIDRAFDAAKASR